MFQVQDPAQHPRTADLEQPNTMSAHTPDANPNGLDAGSIPHVMTRKADDQIEPALDLLAAQARRFRERMDNGGAEHLTEVIRAELLAQCRDAHPAAVTSNGAA